MPVLLQRQFSASPLRSTVPGFGGKTAVALKKFLDEHSPSAATDDRPGVSPKP
ncbi:MAG: hypothetical protein NT105_01585 [Verrucomicrobia bacterium]|nr:hypothetical protein [Verrucomicrobiota bacterium]